MTLISFFLIITFVMVVHELGHLIAAKQAGVIVTEFGIGYPPRIWKFWQGKGSITLDGQEFLIGRKTNLPRNIRVGSEVIIELTPRPDSKPEITYLELVSPEESKDIYKLDPSAGISPKSAIVSDPPIFTVEALTRPTEYTLNWIFLFSFTRMLGEEYPSGPGSFASKRKLPRFIVVAAGPAMNLVIAVLLFSLAAMSGVPEPVTGINAEGEQVPVARTVITDVLPNTPAERAGLQANDVIIGADDVEFKYVGDLVTYIRNHKGVEINLWLDRDGEVITVPVVPRISSPENEGAVGFSFRYEGTEPQFVYYPPHRALLWGISQTSDYVGLALYSILGNIFSAGETQSTRPAEPVGLYQQIGSANEARISLNWWFPILWLIALLSIARVFVFPLLPHWDGPRILFIIIEVFTRKRIIPTQVRGIYFSGLAILIILRLASAYLFPSSY